MNFKPHNEEDLRLRIIDIFERNDRPEIKSIINTILNEYDLDNEWEIAIKALFDKLETYLGKGNIKYSIGNKLGIEEDEYAHYHFGVFYKDKIYRTLLILKKPFDPDIIIDERKIKHESSADFFKTKI